MNSRCAQCGRPVELAKRSTCEKCARETLGQALTFDQLADEDEDTEPGSLFDAGGEA